MTIGSRFSDSTRRPRRRAASLVFAVVVALAAVALGPACRAFLASVRTPRPMGASPQVSGATPASPHDGAAATGATSRSH